MFLSCYRGQPEATKRAFDLATALIKDPSKDIEQLLPRQAKKTPPSGSSSARSTSNVWHNSNSGSGAAQASQTKGATSGAGRNSKQSGASTVSTTTTTSRASITSATKPTMSHVSAQMANGTAIWGNPGQSSRPNPTLGMFTNIVAKERSPGGASRQLFPGEEKEARLKGMTSTHALVTTFSAPTVAKTSLVDSSMPACSPRESDAMQSSARLLMAPISRPTAIGSHLPQAPAGALQPTATSAAQARNFSPFSTNPISRITDGMLNAKKEDEGRMDFAGAARVGVVSAASSNSSSSFVESRAAGAPEVQEENPSRAPGYNAPGNRNSSPKMEDGESNDLSSPFLNFDLQRFSGLSDCLSGSLLPPHAGFSFTPDFGFATTRAQEPFRAPGFPQQPPTRSDAFRGSPFMSATNSPRQSMSSEQLRAHMRPPPAAGTSLFREDEHSYPNTPMTLPTIQSKLNPDAPHFIARHPGMPPPPQQPGTPAHSSPSMPTPTQMHPAFRPSYTASPFNLASNAINANELQNLMSRGLFKPFSPDKGKRKSTAFQLHKISSSFT